MSENNNNPVDQQASSNRNNNQEMKAEGRRNVLKGVAIGGVLAGTQVDRWAKPVVETVVLPAHAQTSADETTDSPEQNTDSGPAALSSITLRGTCSNVPDDQYHTVVWSADPPVSGETATITAVGSDPGTPSGDDLVIFARHSDTYLIAVIRRADGEFNVQAVDCANPVADSTNIVSGLESGASYSRTDDEGGTAGAPFVTLSGFIAT